MKKLISILLLALAQPTLASSFDFYVLSLSWSPEFCNIKPEERQCGRGYGLVLHGLWPQFERGYPQSCSKERVSNAVLRDYADIFPDKKLAIHEWKKHGTCSDLSPEAYYKLSGQLKNSFVVPPEMRDLTQPLRVSSAQLNAKILAANPGLTADALAFSCTGSGRFLQEIYICYDREGQSSRACSAEMQRRSKKSCAQDSFLIRNIR